MKRRHGEMTASQMKKLHFDELSTDFLTRNELCIDLFLEKVWLSWVRKHLRVAYLYCLRT